MVLKRMEETAPGETICLTYADVRVLLVYINALLIAANE